MICIVLIFSLDSTEMKWNFAVALVGNVIVTLIFWLFFKIKEKFEEYSKTAVPSLISLTWFFIFLPFIGIIPSAMIYLSINSESYVEYERMVIACVVLLILLGMSLVVIIFHLYFKRRENQRKFKFIACKVIKKLAKSHVKVDFYMVNLLY